MMTFFPRLYEDELLYSALARYHKRSGNLTYRETLEDVFGNKSIAPSIYLQSSIHNIIDNMPKNFNYTEEEIIYNHTLYPFYTAFMNKDDSDKVYKLMLNESGGRANTKVGIIAKGTSKNKYLRFCPKCMEEDIRKYGETYWHRIHQVPEYIVCSKHKTLIQNSSVEINRYNRYELIAANVDNCILEDDSSIKFNQKTYERLIVLSENIELLLKGNNIKRENDWFKENYKNYLKALNLSSVNGVVKQDIVRNELEKYFGKEFLTILNLNIKNDIKKSWLKKILSSSQHINVPINNLVIIDFLGANIKDIFNKIYTYDPFGKGPWICLNKEENHYGQNTIKDVSIRYDHKSQKIEGTFKCFCGYEYRLRYNKPLIYKENQVNLNNISRLKDFNEIIRELNQNNKFKDEKLGEVELILGRKIISEEHRTKLNESIESVRNKHRYIWINLRNKYPNKSKSELIEMCIATASWLYKFDQEWFNKNSPVKKSNIKKSNIKNWDEKDKEIVKEINKIIEEIQKMQPPLRVTKSRIAKMYSSESMLLLNLDNLTKTKELINNKIETAQEFRIRKVKWKIKDLLSKGETVTFTKLLSTFKLDEKESKELKLIIREEIEI